MRVLHLVRARALQVALASVDIDEADELVEEYGVTAVPHFVVLKNGKKVGEYVGSKSTDLEAVVVQAADGPSDRVS